MASAFPSTSLVTDVDEGEASLLRLLPPVLLMVYEKS